MISPMLQAYLRLRCAHFQQLCQLTSSEHQHVDLAAHRQVLEDVHHLGVAQRLHVLPVDLLDDVALQQAAAPLGIQDHLHLLTQGAVCNGEAEASGAFHQGHAHQLRLQQSGIRAFLVVRKVVVLVVRMVVVVASSIGHGRHCGDLPGEGSSVWDCVVGVLWGGGGGGRGSVLGGGETSRGLLAAAGVLGQWVAPAQHHVHVLVDGDGLEHLHHVSVSLPQHTCAVYVHDHIT